MLVAGRRRKRPYKLLHRGDRHYIEVEIARGKSCREIAAALGVDHTTVAREVKRGLCTQYGPDGKTRVYKAERAQRLHDASMAWRGRHKLYGMESGPLEAACRLMRQSYSPYAAREIVASRTHESVPSTWTLYRYIRAGAIPVRESHLLRGFLDSRRVKGNKLPFHERRSLDHAGGFSIEKRPKVVLKRKLFGDWEGDLVVGPRSTEQALLTLVERKSRYLIVRKVKDKSAASVKAALDGIEAELGGAMGAIFRSVTFDNGAEFSDAPGMLGGGRIGTVYYAHPYCSGERGSNENANGFIRRFIPKGSRIEDYSDQDIADIAEFINTYPRKILDGRCAADIFAEETGWLFAAA